MTQKEVPCDQQIVVRMPTSLVERIDLVVDRMRIEAQGKGDRAKIKRSDAVRKVLAEALPALPVLGETVG